MANKVYVVARNARGGPTLQHKVPDHVASRTCCGVWIDGWSRAYMTRPIEQILCRQKGCRA